MARKKVPTEVEANLLLRCRRRCAVCFGINRDSSVKTGQIAHLDRNPSHNNIDNLAFLCFDHHDQYDSIPSQSKRFTTTEVRVFKAELEESLAAALATPLVLNPPIHVTAEAVRINWTGIYRAKTSYSEAELEILELEDNRYSVKGLAFYSTALDSGPNIGELEAAGIIENDTLVVREGDYLLRLRQTHLGAIGEEKFQQTPFGQNVTFAMEYRKIPHGADAIPQPERRLFESEFWPEEGVPLFITRVGKLLLHARPTPDAPILAEWNTEVATPVPFDGFRYRTVRPGLLIAHRAGDLVGRNLGRTDYVSHANYYEDGGENVTVQFQAGDRFDYLQYRAEGTAFLRWQGLVLDAPVLGELELRYPPIAESWARVTDPITGTVGWVLADEQLEEVRRNF